MELLHKLIDCEVKKLNDLTYEFVASTEDIDRDGEVIEVKGWDLKNLKRNPVITFAHDYRSLPIGKSPKVWVADGKLRNQVEFPAEGVYPFADTVRRLVDGGFLRTESVGFKPAPDSVVEEDGDGVKTPRRRYTKQELLEIAIVPVPSNPNALIEAKTKGIITEVELKSLLVDDIVIEPITGKPFPSKEEDKDGVFIEQAREVPKKEEVEKQPSLRPVSQASLTDEIDYLRQLIREAGLNEETKQKALELVKDILGGKVKTDMAQMKKMHDMMADCEENAAKAKNMAQSAMDDMKTERSPGNDIPVEIKALEPQPKSPEPLDPAEIAQAVAQEIRRLTGRLT